MRGLLRYEFAEDLAVTGSETIAERPAVGLGRWGEKHLRVLRDIGSTVGSPTFLPSVASGRWPAGVEPAHAVETTEPRWTRRRRGRRHARGHHLAIAETCLGRASLLHREPLTQTAAEGPAGPATGPEDRTDGAGGPTLPVPSRARGPRGRPLGRADRLRPICDGPLLGLQAPTMDVGVFQPTAFTMSICSAILLGRDPRRLSGLQRDFLGRGLERSLLVVRGLRRTVPVVIEANYFLPGTHRDASDRGAGSLVADYGTSTVTPPHRCGTGRAARLEARTPARKAAAAGGEPLRLELEAFIDACEAAARAGDRRRRPARGRWSPRPRRTRPPRPCRHARRAPQTLSPALKSSLSGALSWPTMIA